MYRVNCCVRTKCVVSVLDSKLNAVIVPVIHDMMIEAQRKSRVSHERWCRVHVILFTRDARDSGA